MAKRIMLSLILTIVVLWITVSIVVVGCCVAAARGERSSAARAGRASRAGHARRVGRARPAA